MAQNHRFQRAKKDAEQIIGRLIRSYYAETLAKVKPRIDVLMCYSPKDEAGNAKGPALSHNGAPAAATIKSNSLLLRALGLGDVLICVDGDLWPDLSDLQKEALMDHELYHLVPKQKTGDEAGWKMDDLDRPLFGMREHDFQFGWFTAIAARHGAASMEVQQALRIRQKSGQMLFDFPVTQPELPAEPQRTGTDDAPAGSSPDGTTSIVEEHEVVGEPMVSA